MDIFVMFSGWAHMYMLIVIALLTVLTGSYGSIYVSPLPPCSDHNSGTESAPFCTIDAAIACATQDNLTNPDVVLRAGVFWLQQPIHLSLVHSGLTLRAAPNERVTVSGGIAVVGPWAPPGKPNDKAWTTPIPSALRHPGPSPRQLYVNGNRATRSVGNASTLFGTMKLITGTQTPSGTQPSHYSVEKPMLAGCRNPHDIEFVYTAQIRPWTEPRCGVVNVSDDGTVINMEPCINQLIPTPNAPRRWFMSGLPATAENVYELLSQPGQFYIDKPAGEILYIPRAGEDMTTATAVVPMLESVLVANNVPDLTFSGIDFSHTAWNQADTPCGYIPTQAGWHATTSACIDITIDNPQSTMAQAHVHHSGNSRTVSTTPHVFVLGDGGLSALISTGPSTLTSESGLASLTMQGDGNVCTRVSATTNAWCSGFSKSGSIDPYELRVQNDGNLCTADVKTGKATWCARGTAVPMGPYYLLLADDGSACVHAGVYPATNGTVWCAPLQAASYLRPIPAAVLLNNTIGATVTTCTFTHMGGTGLGLSEGTQNTVVTGNYATDISGSAMQVGGVQPCPACPTCGATSKDGPCPSTWSRLNTFNNTLIDNVIADVTIEYRGCTGVWAGYNANFTFTHNNICRVAYGGISLGWGWAIPTSSVFNNGNELSFNRISEWLRVLADSGATYTLGPHPNSVVHDNYIHNGGSGIEPDGSFHGNGYYPDDGSTWWHIFNNVAANLNGGKWLFAWNPNDEANLTVYNNFADTSQYLCATKTCNFYNNTVVNVSSGQAWPPQATSIMEQAGAKKTHTHPDALNACSITKHK